MLTLFIKGALIGFLLALPVGPTVILCVRYSLTLGAITGLVTGAGSGLADAVYGVLAGYSAFAFFDMINSAGLYLHLIAGLILCYLGYSAFKKTIDVRKNYPLTSRPLTKLFLTTFSLTVSSPLTFVGVSALCASFEIENYLENVFSPWILGLGLMMGSCLWWATLSLSLSFFKKKIASSVQHLIGKISGSILGTMGLFLIGYSIFLYFKS